MSTRFADAEVSREPLPVCLWKENPNRLVSLWDMLRFLAHDFVSVMHGLTLLEQKLPSGGAAAYDPKEVGPILGHIQYESKNLGLISASKQIRRIQRRFEESLAVPEDQGMTATEMGELLSELRRRVEEDLEETVLLRIESPKIEEFFYRETKGGRPHIDLLPMDHILSPQIVINFPSAIPEFKEAVRCYIADRNTGCVFHLMRALEFGLSALGKVFDVSLEHTNWGNAIELIESRIREMHKDAKWKVFPDCKSQQEFYSQAASHFIVFKDAWRNHTAHVRSKYGPEDAIEIFRAARAVFRKLATKLSEQKMGS